MFSRNMRRIQTRIAPFCSEEWFYERESTYVFLIFGQTFKRNILQFRSDVRRFNSPIQSLAVVRVRR